MIIGILTYCAACVALIGVCIFDMYNENNHNVVTPIEIEMQQLKTNVM